ncbi:uncharacterized protein [Palaemon carinicauda]|uniref:uncharacterized protein n=1 Tax=Palaemon carinicauda TaxID=392227 RepID=UPI0035B5F07E
MRIAHLLCAICASFWSSKHPWALSESTKGFFITTGVEYKEVMPSDVINRNNLLVRHDITSYPASGLDAVLECGRRCVNINGCFSFLMEPSKRRCHLSRLDRCITMDNILTKRDGLIYYEVLSHAKTNTTETCFAKCLKQHSCKDCGRPHCSGELCNECLSFCWDIPGGYNGSITLWDKDLRRVKKTCYNEWEALWLQGKLT